MPVYIYFFIYGDIFLILCIPTIFSVHAKQQRYWFLEVSSLLLRMENSSFVSEKKIEDIYI